MFAYNIARAALLTTISLGIISCDGGSDSTSTEITSSDTSSSDDSNDATIDDEVAAVGLNPDYFVSGALASPIETEDCTLSNGQTSTCYRIVIAGAPADQDIGTFCPGDIYASADEAGIWFDGGGEVYDLDGEFITNLANLYGDSNWLLYDVASGEVNVTDTLEACNGAARPNVAPEYQNHCVECSMEYVGGGVSQTYLIPVTPVVASTPSAVRDVGVSLNGVNLAAPAPIDAILGAYTIAAFDDCAGHINPVAGYHYHGATGCTEIIAQNDGHSSLLGYALDGYGIYGMLDNNNEEPTDLDACRGHGDEDRGYHYHAASAAENMFIGCFSGEVAR